MECFFATLLDNYPRTSEFVGKFGSVFVAIVAAAIAGGIAYRQWKTAHDRLRFDLFEKRYDMYEAVMKTLATVVRSGNAPHDKRLQMFRALKRSDFLFDEGMVNYLNDLQMKMIELDHREKLIRDEPDDPERSDNISEARKLKDSLEVEFRQGAKLQFARFISFGHLK